MCIRDRMKSFINPRNELTINLKLTLLSPLILLTKIVFVSPILSLLIFKAKRNSFTIKRVDDLEKKIGNKKPLFLKSNKFNFIPLMLSINIKTKQLSLEHTHPPTEFFYGLKKYEAVKLIKNEWLQDE